MKKETGYTFCRGKKITKGKTVTGGTHSVSIPISCPPGSKPRALVHTHPGGSIRPSPQDIRTMKDKNLTVCIKAGGKLKCYRPKRKT